MRSIIEADRRRLLRCWLLVIGVVALPISARATEPTVIELAQAAATKTAEEQKAAQAAVDQQAKWSEQADSALAAANQAVVAAKDVSEKSAAAAQSAAGDALPLATAQSAAAAAALTAAEQTAAAAKATADNAAAGKAAAAKTLAEKTAAASSAALKVLAEQAFASQMALRQAHNERTAAGQELAKKTDAANNAAAAKDAANNAAAKAAEQQAAAEKALAEKAAAAKAASDVATAEPDPAKKLALQDAAQKAEAERAGAEAALAPVVAAAKTAADAAQAAVTAADQTAAERTAAAAADAEKQAAVVAATRAAADAEAVAMGGLKPINPEQWDYAKARHLLLRAGFGGSPEEVSKLHTMGLYAAVDYLVNYHRQPSWPNTFEPRPIERGLGYEDSLEPRERNQLNDERVNAERSQQAEFRQWWLRRMVETQRPLEEKLTLFWHDHFATGYEDKFYQTEILHQQNQLLRKYADKVDGLLRGIVHDPAMILYLDNQVNVKGRGNENFGRELLELFTLGRDQGYGEQDLRELSRALTGYSYVGHTNQFRFNGSQFDEGPKTILGQTGNFSADEAIDIIMQHPSSARCIAKKLFEFFAHRHPSDEVIEQLAHVLRSNRSDLAPMLKNLFRSEEFYSERAMGQQIKSPVDLMVGTIRVAGLKQVDYNFVDQALQAMGQTLYQPPNVGGWEEGRAWISANRILLRYNAVADLVEKSQLDVAAMLNGKGASVAEFVDYLSQACLVTNLSDGQRQELVAFVGELPPAAQWRKSTRPLTPSCAECWNS